ncbi:hypothetical protein GWK47_000082 [Chionoecetes opilio]|uniref:Uncharacterized protein n=1 Tax=Chionoecetes opilio TaxID=41210 RepID=A0A8J4XZ51_CHIOP|nr:hypothetical protein GWK47_000082 [Chionoecetes opilio]
MMSLRCLPLHTLVATVRQVVKQPPHCGGIPSDPAPGGDVCCRCSTCMRSSVPGLSWGSGWGGSAVAWRIVQGQIAGILQYIAGSGLGSTTWLRTQPHGEGRAPRRRKCVNGLNSMLSVQCGGPECAAERWRLFGRACT